MDGGRSVECERADMNERKMCKVRYERGVAVMVLEKSLDGWWKVS